MRAHSKWLAAYTAAGVCWFTMVAAAAAEDASDPPAEAVGKALFQKRWAAAKPAGVLGSDGLGPMFNAVSCDACHNQGGVGGGGSIDFNVDLYNAFNSDAILTQQNDYGATWQNALTVIQPRFVKFSARWDF